MVIYILVNSGCHNNLVSDSTVSICKFRHTNKKIPCYWKDAILTWGPKTHLCIINFGNNLFRYRQDACLAQSLIDQTHYDYWSNNFQPNLDDKIFQENLPENEVSMWWLFEAKWCIYMRQNTRQCWLLIGLLVTNFALTYWRHQMEAVSALLALCEGNPPVTDSPHKGPVTRALILFLWC